MAVLDAEHPVAPTTSANEPERSYRLEIFLVSLAGLLLEISYTRVISFKLFYYYTYLIIGLALLGIGTGGVIVAVSSRIRRASTDTIMLWSFVFGAASIAAGYVVIAVIRIDSLSIWEYDGSSVWNLVLLVVVCFTLFASFIAVGVIVATLFGRKPDRIGSLYFADLVGAALACFVVVWLLLWIGPPATIMLAGLIFAAAGLRIAARRRSRLVPVAGVLAVLFAIATVAPTVLPQQRTDTGKTDLNEDTTVFTAWSPVFRIDVWELPCTICTDGGSVRLLLHDGLFGSAIYPWDGKVSSLTRFDTDPRSIPFGALGTAPDDVLVIGAAGGNEVLASLYYGAEHVDAIELNPKTYSLVTDEMADYSGHLADNPRVNYVQGEGRTWLARSDDRYDLVWFPAPDSYSATNAASSGAFVLSESYLYTKEAIKDSFDHLAPGGIIATQYGELDYDRPNRTTRYVSTARAALEEAGVDDPARHIVVATTADRGTNGALSTILVKKEPFTKQEVDGALAALPKVEPTTTLRYAPGHEVAGSSVSELATIPDSRLGDWYDDYPYDVRPVTDDKPFFWHFRQFDDVITSFTDRIDHRDPEDTIGERVLILFLVIALVMAAVFLLLPFVAIRETWRRLPRKGTSAVYFLLLGLGFMFFEITLIQRLTLFLGYPTYSLTVTLASILLFTGLGALLSGRFATSPARVIPPLLLAIVALALFYQFGLPGLTDALLGAPLAVRVATAFVVLAPLGLCLGMFMPIGLGAVSRLSDGSSEYVAWSWAVNGFASVVGAVLSTILAMSYGFGIVLWIALVAYLAALAVLRTLVRAAPLPA
jgi:hypothetical protein